MNYLLTVQRTTSDKRRQLLMHDLYTDEDYQMRLRALVEDMDTLPESKARLLSKITEPTATIAITSQQSRNELMDSMKPFFKREMGYIQCIELKQA